MSGEILTLLCLVYRTGDKPSPRDLFPVEIANTKLVGTLKKAIKKEMKPNFDGFPTKDLKLKRFGDYIKNSHNPKEDTLPAKPLCHLFPKQPDEETLSIIIKEPSVHSEEEEEHYEKFRQIILTVEKKGDFSHDDEAFNGIAMWTGELPDFVKVVENKLKAKRDLPVRDKEALLREFDLSPNYDFGTSYDFTPLLEEERHGEELSELA
ncbi:hypothetical protein EW145_g8590, partial [Phellinidium pouzarii]